MKWLFDWVDAWFAANRGRAILVGWIALLQGLIYVPFELYDIAQIPWDIREGAAEATTGYARCNRWGGTQYKIRIDGLAYTCEGGGLKCSPGITRVLYDPSDPDRCRVASAAARPSEFQLVFLCSGVLGLNGGIVLLLGARRSYVSPKRPRRLYRALLLSALGLSVLLSCYTTWTILVAR